MAVKFVKVEFPTERDAGAALVGLMRRGRMTCLRDGTFILPLPALKWLEENRIPHSVLQQTLRDLLTPRHNDGSPVGAAEFMATRQELVAQFGACSRIRVRFQCRPRSWSQIALIVWSGMTFCPNSFRGRAEISGIGFLGVFFDGNGTNRASGWRLRVIATSSPACTQANTRGKFCLKSRTDALFM